jgi:hypothetical protein
MKQNITDQDYFSLTQKARGKLDKWYAEHYFEKGRAYTDVFPYLSIGEMIEFLVDNETKDCDFFIDKVGKWTFEGDHGIFWASEKSTNSHDELCDALWEACKTVLEETV